MKEELKGGQRRTEGDMLYFNSKRSTLNRIGV